MTSNLASGAFFNCAVYNAKVSCWGDNSVEQSNVPQHAINLNKNNNVSNTNESSNDPL
jgi:hypothetical protein